MKPVGLPYLLILWIPFLSCQREHRGDCFKGTGTRTTESRLLENFSRITAEGNVDIILVQDSVPEVRIEAGENLIPGIRSEVIDGELHIGNNNRCNWARSYKKGNITVRVSSPVIKKISHLGTGFISTLDSITGDSLVIFTYESGNLDLKIHMNILFTQMHGSADVKVRGAAILHGNYHVGTGYLYADELRNEITWTHSRASGNEYFNAGKQLSATLDWAGDIYYKGKPDIFVKGPGPGKLIPIN